MTPSGGPFEHAYADAAGLRELSLAHIAGGRTRREPACWLSAAERLLNPPSPLGYAYQLFAAGGWSSLPWLHRISQPTLVVAGEDDPSVPLRNSLDARGTVPGQPPAHRRGGRSPLPTRRAGAARARSADVWTSPDASPLRAVVGDTQLA